MEGGGVGGGGGVGVGACEREGDQKCTSNLDTSVLYDCACMHIYCNTWAAPIERLQ